MVKKNAELLMITLESFELCESHLISQSPRKSMQESSIKVQFMDDYQPQSIRSNYQIVETSKYQLNFSSFIDKYELEVPFELYSLPDGISQHSVVKSSNSQSGVYLVDEVLKSDPNNLVSLGLVYLLKLPEVVVEKAKEIIQNEELAKDLLNVMYETPEIEEFYTDTFGLDKIRCEEGHTLFPTYCIEQTGDTEYSKYRSDGLICTKCDFTTDLVDLQRLYPDKSRNAPLPHEFADFLSISIDLSSI